MSDNVIPLPRDDDLPGTLSGFMERFPDNESCAAFLRLWRYGPKGFACPRCGGTSAWFLPSRNLDECTACHKQVSLTSGTIMHRSRKPLQLWFLAMFLFVVSKQGISALNLSRHPEPANNFGTLSSRVYRVSTSLSSGDPDYRIVEIEADIEDVGFDCLVESHSQLLHLGRQATLVNDLIETLTNDG